MTRFAIHNGFMYIADQSSITVFDIRNDAFEKIKVVDVEIGLETIFAYGEYLYLGHWLVKHRSGGLSFRQYYLLGDRGKYFRLCGKCQ